MPNVIIGLADLYCEDSLVDCDFLHRSRGHCNSFQEFRLVLKFFLFSEAVVKVFHIGFFRKTIRKYKLKFVKKKLRFPFFFLLRRSHCRYILCARTCGMCGISLRLYYISTHHPFIYIQVISRFLQIGFHPPAYRQY